MRINWKILAVGLFIAVLLPTRIFAESEVLEGKVVEAEGEEIQQLEVVITGESLRGSKLLIENGQISGVKYQVGDEVMVSKGKDQDGQDRYTVTDYLRRKSLAGLVLIFAVLAVITGGLLGFSSLIGMGISFAVIFAYILPKIMAGNDPVIAVILGSLVIIPATFILSHGFNKKTLVAIGGTLIALIFTGILATSYVERAKLTGFASEEAGFLQAFYPGEIDIKALLLAGIIIGVLGVLDDITVSQSSVVEQLAKTGNQLTRRELYNRAMKVGRDHIASMINTLVLVYAGASLPLLLLFMDNPRPLSELVNYEIIAEEVVRTMVGSIGLMLAVPVTTVIATMVFSNNKIKSIK